MCQKQTLQKTECERRPRRLGARHNPVTRSPHSAGTPRIKPSMNGQYEQDESICLSDLSDSDGVLRSRE